MKLGLKHLLILVRDLMPVFNILHEESFLVLRGGQCWSGRQRKYLVLYACFVFNQGFAASQKEALQKIIIRAMGCCSV